MNLAKRIEALEGRYKPEILKNREMEKAVTALYEALHTSLPSDQPKKVPSARYSHAITYDYTGCIRFEDKLGQLMNNIECDLMSESDKSIINSLPQWALEVMNMTAIDYLTMYNDLINRY